VGAKGSSVSRRSKYRRKAMYSSTECACLLDCHALPYRKKILFLIYSASYHTAIIIRQLLSDKLQQNTFFLNLSTARNISCCISPFIRKS